MPFIKSKASKLKLSAKAGHPTAMNDLSLPAWQVANVLGSTPRTTGYWLLCRVF